MSKTRRKACSSNRISPEKLWDLFHVEFPDGVCPYEFDRLGNKFQDDISKVKFDFENFYYSHLEEDLGKGNGWLGSRKFWTRSPLTCFSFIGCFAGGDWEWPVNFLIYLDKDGKTFRGYIPKDGNVWNYDTKQAFGNDPDKDSDFLKKWIKKNMPERVDGNFEEEEFEYDDSEIMQDYSKIAHEMMFRFEAV